MSHAPQSGSSYEIKLIVILALLWGIVGIDRLVIVYLFPVLMPELHINNMQAGEIASILSLTWAISAWYLGGVSDRKGRKGVLIGTSVFFSLMTWLTGIAGNFHSMLAVRGLLGIGEGGVFSSSVATIAESSTPKRRGFNLGLHQSFFPLLGIGLGPIIATQLVSVMPWHWVFFVLGIPSLILTLALAHLMKNPAKIAQQSGLEKSRTPQVSVFKVRNVWLCTAIASLYMTVLFVFSTFVALYLTKVVGLPLTTVGMIVSGWGLGGFLGMIVMPSLSDHVGRRPMVVCCAAVYGLLMLLFAFSHASAPVLFCILFVAGLFGFGIAPLTLSIIPSESVHANQAGAAVGVPTAVSELVGGVLMPVVAGGLADMYGLSVPMMIVGIVSLVSALIGLFLLETAPNLVGTGGDLQTDDMQVGSVK